MDATTEIRRSPEQVWEFVADPSNDVKWRTRVTESGLTSDPPLILGSEGYVRVGRTVIHWRVVDIDPGSSVDWDLLDGPIRGLGGYRLESLGANTRFTLVADVEPKGVLRQMGPLFGWIGRKAGQADVDKLKKLLEAANT
jgi:hypothetical protein